MWDKTLEIRAGQILLADRCLYEPLTSSRLTPIFLVRLTVGLYPGKEVASFFGGFLTRSNL